MKYGSSSNWIFSNSVISTWMIYSKNHILDSAGVFW
mgnify:CR=1 FL=1